MYVSCIKLITVNEQRLDYHTKLFNEIVHAARDSAFALFKCFIMMISLSTDIKEALSKTIYFTVLIYYSRNTRPKWKCDQFLSGITDQIITLKLKFCPKRHVNYLL